MNSRADELLLDSKSFLVSETDEKGIIRFANDEFCKYAGYTNEELIGKPHNIAFQTNILSLNAAAEAANEIKTLVENAANKANDGKNISDEMIKGYNKLTQKINDTMNLIKDIEEASKVQEVSIVQINDTISSLDAQTQQNADIASQTNNSALQMDNISKEIEHSVNQKKI